MLFAESVLFIGTRSSNLYTAVDSCSSGVKASLIGERVGSLLVLDSVTSTPQWIRQPKPRGCAHDVCVFVYGCVLGRSRGSKPLDIW